MRSRAWWMGIGAVGLLSCATGTGADGSDGADEATEGSAGSQATTSQGGAPTTTDSESDPPPPAQGGTTNGGEDPPPVSSGGAGTPPPPPGGEGGATNPGDPSPPTDCAALLPEDVIADFELGTAKTAAVLAPTARGNTSYYYYNDKSPTGVLDPPKIESQPLVATSGGCGMYAFRFSATGFTSWGAGLAADFLPKVNDLKVGFDASAYTAIAFLAKVSGGPTEFFVNAQDVNTHPDGGQCTDTAGEEQCDAWGGMITIGTAWELKTIPFAALQQRGFGKAAPGFDASQIISFRLQARGDFELWIDDVRFVK